MLKHGFAIESNRKSVKYKFYSSWADIKGRCYNVKSKSYHNYGGRGIKLDPKWLIFNNFKHDMFDSFVAHFKKHGSFNTTLERIDNNIGYNLSNCRWATRKEQAQNRRTTRLISYKDKQYTISELCKIFNRCHSTISGRIARGIPLDQPYH